MPLGGLGDLVLRLDTLPLPVLLPPRARCLLSVSPFLVSVLPFLFFFFLACFQVRVLKHNNLFLARPQAPAAAPPASNVVRGVALYDFDPSNEGEVGIKEGDSLVVLDQSDADWTKISVDGNEGYVPRNYIEIS